MTLPRFFSAMTLAWVALGVWAFFAGDTDVMRMAVVCATVCGATGVLLGELRKGNSQ